MWECVYALVCVCCQLISRARRLSRAKIFLPLVNFTRQLQFCLRCPAFLIHVLIHIHIHLPVLEWILHSYFDANHSRHVQLIELKSRRVAGHRFNVIVIVA